MFMPKDNNIEFIYSGESFFLQKFRKQKLIDSV